MTTTRVVLDGRLVEETTDHGDGKVSLWRIVVVGSDGDPTVLAFRMQLYDV